MTQHFPAFAPIVATARAVERLPYREFLETKVRMAQPLGIEVADGDINPILKPHARAIVRWAVRGGRRAIFAAFGLGKSVIQLEILRILLNHAGGRGLIVLPLGVRQEFRKDVRLLMTGEHPKISDAERAALAAWLDGRPERQLGIEFIRSIDQCGESGLYMTNYETVRDGRLDPADFTVASLDEASVLRSFGSLTYQSFLTLFDRVRYRFVATATPSPNRFKELIHYAGFLGVMDTGQALTRFFQRDSEKAGNLTLFPHKEQEFWLWVASWGVFLQRPSDLGFSDDGYDLPELRVNWHEVKTDLADAGADRDGQGILFRGGVRGLASEAKERRDTLPARIAKLQEIVEAAPGEHFILWHDLEDERRAIEAALPAREYDAWLEYRDGHPRGLELYERHYSAHQYADGRERNLFAGPGFKTVLLTREHDALFVWRKFIDDSGQQGINCAVFRNEGRRLSSDLIREAMAIGWKRWPGERFYTFVDERKTASRRGKNSPAGKCFIAAGWRRCGTTKSGLAILEALPGTDVPAVEAKEALRAVYGSQDLDAREQLVIDFSEGRFRLLAGKPVMLGSGCNFQRHCHRAVFVGVNHKFNDFLQAIHRLRRFLQEHPVEIDIVYAESERETVVDLKAKWARHNQLVEEMSKIIRKYGLNHDEMVEDLVRSIGVTRIEAAGEGWQVANNDCVPEMQGIGSDSLDLVVTSIPFSKKYEYTESYHDFGHADDDDAFFGQLDYLTPELFRALKPGRLACIHIKDTIEFGSVNGLGFPTVNPLHAKCIAHYLAHGFAYMGLIYIDTDVVRENNQTYRLTMKEQLKDGTRMGVGSPEFVLLLRKPQTDRTRGYADNPVQKRITEYSLARWQLDAHARWRSDGNRFLTVEELSALGPDVLGKVFKEQTRHEIYNFESHVRIGEALAARRQLPTKFMALMPGSARADVWDDVNRMLTLNGDQARKSLEKHVCPLQFDIVDRLIERYSNPGELVFDPFGGLFTVPYRALALKRRGRAVELNPGYFLDGVKYLEAQERAVGMPTLFDLMGIEDQQAA
jgi:DNA modification methylase